MDGTVITHQTPLINYLSPQNIISAYFLLFHKNNKVFGLRGLQGLSVSIQLKEW